MNEYHNSSDEDEVQPSSNLKKNDESSYNKNEFSYINTNKDVNDRNSETVFIKRLSYCESSVEEQKFYLQIIKNCMGLDEIERIRALTMLVNDMNIVNIYSKFCIFIKCQVEIYISECNILMLSFLMRMAKALLLNNSIYIPKHLHILLPPIISCIVCKKLGLSKSPNNEFRLRNFSIRLLANICEKYNNNVTRITMRVTTLLCKPLLEEKRSLLSLYGGLAGLFELNRENIKKYIIPQLNNISKRIKEADEKMQLDIDKEVIRYIKAFLGEICSPILKQMHDPPDIVQNYTKEYGALGECLCLAVIRYRYASKVNSLHGKLVKGGNMGIQKRSRSSDSELSWENQCEFILENPEEFIKYSMSASNRNVTKQYKKQANKEKIISQESTKRVPILLRPGRVRIKATPEGIPKVYTGDIYESPTPTPQCNVPPLNSHSRSTRCIPAPRGAYQTMSAPRLNIPVNTQRIFVKDIKILRSPSYYTQSTTSTLDPSTIQPRQWHTVSSETPSSPSVVLKNITIIPSPSYNRNLINTPSPLPSPVPSVNLESDSDDSSSSFTTTKPSHTHEEYSD